MTAITYVDLKWPHMTDLWTGGSDIHRSRAESATIDHGIRQHKAIITTVAYSNLPGQLWDRIYDSFEGAEWLISEAEFCKLMVLDVYRHLNGQGNSQSVKIVNPATGNEFHKIALLEEKYVGGIRWWIEGGYSEESIQICWRFRWALLQQDPNDERASSRQHIEKAMTEFTEMAADIEISEPTDEQVEKARERVQEIH